ncbi:MAG: OadG family protein [Lachnospiraceae bacterium]|nr:OadG family protein [Lachnospiraceae bacterium]
MNVASMSAVLAAATDASSIPSGGLVVLMGMGIVFVGLICIVLLCSLMSKVVKILEKMNESAPAPAAAPVAAPAAAPVAAVQAPVENRQELVAAISAALAEELGTDVSGIRILSLKKV